MKARPILMSAPMVCALLDGRKSQTRRLVKPQPRCLAAHLIEVRRPRGFAEMVYQWDDRQAPNDRFVREQCPYGVLGDLLWVRETWCTVGDDSRVDDLPPSNLQPQRVWYEADGEPPFTDLTGKTRSSIHLPRWASRLTLHITDVRVHRLQEISQADAIAEGAPPSHPSIDRVSREFGYADFPRSWYAQLWDSINGAGAWSADPWVWAISFETIKQSVDAVLASRAAT